MSSDILTTTPYFYIIEHVKSGKKYAGCRYAKGCTPSELLQEDGYTTSSKSVNKIIEEEGLESFRILQILTEDEIGYNVREYETKILRKNNVSRSDDWLNVHENAIGGFQTPEYKAMMLKLYGVEHSFQSDEIKERYKENYKAKTGYTNPSYNPEVKKKRVETTMKNFGVTCSAMHESVKEKAKQTNLKRYGVEYSIQNNEIKEKIKSTNLEKYGEEIAILNPEIQQKKLDTCNEKYGGNSPMCSDEVQQKAKKSMLEKYGYAYNGQRPEVKERIRKIAETRRSYAADQNPAFGKKWLFKENEHRTYVNAESIDMFLSNGYQIGRRFDLPAKKYKEILKDFQ